jgi:hypothetical protein
MPGIGSVRVRRSARRIVTGVLVLAILLAIRLEILAGLEIPLVGRRVAERRGLPTRPLWLLLPNRKAQASRLRIPELVCLVKLLQLL